MSHPSFQYLIGTTENSRKGLLSLFYKEGNGDFGGFSKRPEVNSVAHPGFKTLSFTSFYYRNCL